MLRLQERLDITNARVEEIASALDAAKRVLGASVDESEDRLGGEVDALRKRCAALEERVGALSTLIAERSAQASAPEPVAPPPPTTPAWFVPVLALVAASSVGTWVYVLTSS